jgi:hypothetical protein
MPEDSDMYRVVFGDLHIDDVTPKELQKELRQ